MIVCKLFCKGGEIMASKGITIEERTDKSMIWVKLPEKETNGKTMQTLLESLARQIHAEHMDRIVERMKIDPETRRFIIKFREG